ncbi:MAG: hypothetical protein K0U29_09065 [Gammaproteobacteria bacterium]|nr:hypothetical protein [Gammaproteobacteria bacterium]
MNTAELNNLEFQIESLIQTLQRLRTDNQALKHKLANSTRERSRLQELNIKSAGKIKQIITQLKDELR